MKKSFAAFAFIAAAACCTALVACGNKPVTLKSIDVSGTVKTRYIVGDRFDGDGMIVTAHYSDGTSREVKDYALSAPRGELTADDTEFTVDYYGLSATRNITVGLADWAESETAIRADFKKNKSSHTYNGTTIQYCVRTPDDNSSPAPLVLFLHGMGERGSDNETQLRLAIAKAYTRYDSMFYDSFVIAPQCPYEPKDEQTGKRPQWVSHMDDGSYKSEEVAETPYLATVADLVKEYIAKPEVDGRRVYVMGMSMGGYGTWDILGRHTELFAAAVPICGAGPVDRVEALAEIPIYAFHGALDPLVSYETGTKKMYDLIKAQNKNKMRAVIFEQGQHDIWDDAVTYPGDDDNPATIDWLFKQIR